MQWLVPDTERLVHKEKILLVWLLVIMKNIPGEIFTSMHLLTVRAFGGLYMTTLFGRYCYKLLINMLATITMTEQCLVRDLTKEH